MEEKKFKEPELIKAGDERVKLGFASAPPLVDCRVIAEDNYQILMESLLSKDRENIRLRALIDSEQAWALKYEELAIENERLKGLIDKAVIFGCDSRNEEYMTISHQDTLKEFKKKNNL
jgi:hypothetical protein